MLGLIRALPLVAAIVLPLLGGGLGTGAAWLWWSWVELPHALDKQKAVLTSEFEARAEKARADEERRRAALVDRLSAQFQQQQAAEDAQQQLALDLLNQRIADYETGDSDAACRLTQPRLDFLLGGVRDKPAG